MSKILFFFCDSMFAACFQFSRERRLDGWGDVMGRELGSQENVSVRSVFKYELARIGVCQARGMDGIQACFLFGEGQ